MKDHVYHVSYFLNFHYGQINFAINYKCFYFWNLAIVNKDQTKVFKIWNYISNLSTTVEPLKTDTPRDKYKCPSYRGVRLMEVIFNRNHLLGQWKVSVLERCPSYGMSVLRGFTVYASATFTLFRNIFKWIMGV